MSINRLQFDTGLLMPAAILAAVRRNPELCVGNEAEHGEEGLLHALARYRRGLPRGPRRRAIHH